MKIYTSYFAQFSTLTKAGIMPVSIALVSPWFHGEKCTYLAPTRKILQFKEEPEKYTDHFNRLVLAPLDFSEVIEDFKNLSHGKDIALLCYERPGVFCHRHLVANWLNAYIECHPKGIGLESVKEYQKPNDFPMFANVVL